MTDNHNLIQHIQKEMDKLTVDSSSFSASPVPSTTIPWSSLVALGGFFSALQPTTITTHVDLQQNLNLFIRTDGSGLLNAAKDGSGLIGSFVKDGALRQARFEPLTKLTGTTVLPPDPTLAAIALAIAVAQHETNKRLDAITDLQKEMFDYIKQRDSAKIRGDLVYLSDTLDELQYAWHNDKVLAAKRSELQTIERTANQKISFYRDRLKRSIEAPSSVHTKKASDEKAEEILTEFQEYRLALYIYSFASMLEILTDPDTESAFIRKKIDLVESRSHDYRWLYTQAHSVMEKQAEHIVATRAIDFVARVEQRVGEAIESSPLGPHINVDEALIRSSQKLDTRAQRRINKPLQTLQAIHEPSSTTFLNVMRNLESFLTEPVEFSFDNDGMHYRLIESGTGTELQAPEE